MKPGYFLNNIIIMIVRTIARVKYYYFILFCLFNVITRNERALVCDVKTNETTSIQACKRRRATKMLLLKPEPGHYYNT